VLPPPLDLLPPPHERDGNGGGGMELLPSAKILSAARSGEGALVPRSFQTAVELRVVPQNVLQEHVGDVYSQHQIS
jgi:hypothetical protein